MPFTIRMIIGLLLGHFALFGVPTALASSPPRAEDVFELSASRSGADGLTLHWKIAPGNYVYRDSLHAKLDGLELALALPAGELTNDPNFGKEEIYRGGVEGRLARLPASGTIEVVSRGCAEDSICYPPLTRAVDIATLTVHDATQTIGVAGASDSEPSARFKRDVADQTSQTPPPPPGATSEGDLASVLGGGLIPMLAAFLGFGVLLALTPCIFPMIPILSAVLVGADGKPSAARGFALSLTYALAMAVAYGLVGLVAGTTGANLQVALQTPWALGLSAALFVALSLSMFGLYDLALPAAIARRAPLGSGRGSLAGAALLGFGSALIVGPCVTPPLAAAMLYAVQAGDAGKGAAALFALGFGMGAPLVAAGTFGAGILPKAGPWLDRIRPIFGVVFLAVAVMLVGRLLPGPALLGLWGIFAIGTATFIGAFDHLDATAGPLRRLGKGTGIAGVVYGAVLIVGAASGSGDPFAPLRAPTITSGAAFADHAEPSVGSPAAFDEAFAASRTSGRPVLVIFTADWCTLCKSNEAIMAEPAIRTRIEALPTIVADVTAYTAGTRALMKRFAVVGPPTLLLVDTQGREIPGSRLVGPITIQSLEARLSRAGA